MPVQKYIMVLPLTDVHKKLFLVLNGKIKGFDDNAMTVCFFTWHQNNTTLHQVNYDRMMMYVHVCDNSCKRHKQTAGTLVRLVHMCMSVHGIILHIQLYMCSQTPRTVCTVLPIPVLLSPCVSCYPHACPVLVVSVTPFSFYLCV